MRISVMACKYFYTVHTSCTLIIGQSSPGCRGSKSNLQSHPQPVLKGKRPSHPMFPPAAKQKSFRTTSSLQQDARELSPPPQLPAPPPPVSPSDLTDRDYEDVDTSTDATQDYGQEAAIEYYKETDLLASRPDLQHQSQSQSIHPQRRISKDEHKAEITVSASTSPTTSQRRCKPLCTCTQLLPFMLIEISVASQSFMFIP